MASAGRKILVAILGDATKFDKALADATGSGQKFGNVMTGIGQGIGQKAFGLVVAGAQAAANAMGDVVQGALDEEKVSARLDAALKANVVGWDGNRDAINRYIDAQVNRGFQDDDTTAAMAKLVTATGNVADAESALAIAQDLARGTGSDLATAVDALTKVEGGSYRILKSLGIEMAKGATQTEVLAEVQRRFAGQGASFMDTTIGSMDRFNAKVDQTKDKIGSKLIPVLGFLADNASAAFDVLDNTKHADALVDQTKAFVAAGYSSGIYEQSLKGLIEQYTEAQNSGRATEQELHDLETILNLVGHAAIDAAPPFGSLGRAADDLRAPLDNAKGSVMGVHGSLDDMNIAMLVAKANAYEATRPVREFFDQYTIATNKGDIAQDRLDLLDNAKAVKAAQKAVEEATPGTAAYRRAQLELAVAQGTLAKSHEKLIDDQIILFNTKPDKKTAKELDKYFQHLGLKVGDLTGDAKAAAKAVQQMLHPFIGNATLTIKLSATNVNPQKLAGGGKVGLGDVAIVGEEGPELWTKPGTITPFNQLGSGGGGGSPVVNVYIQGGLIDGPTIDRLTQALATRLRYAPGIR